MASPSLDRTPHLLIVGSDPAIEPEVATALGSLPTYRVIPHYAAHAAQALEIARARQPDLVLVDMGQDVRQLTHLARDLHAEVPGVIVAGMFQEDRLGASQRESALIIEAIRGRVQDFLRRPLSSAELRQLLDRVAAPALQPHRPAGTVVSFISNKGGVGKSTLSVNAACLLARQRPDRVLLVDTSLQLGVCAMMLDLQPVTSIVDAIRQRDRLDETLLTHLTLRHASGLRLLAAPADAMEAAEITDDGIARVLNRARHAFDIVIVDTFPMLDEVVLAILDLSDLGFIVSQATVPSVVGTAKLLPVLETVGFGAARQRFVLNRNHRAFAGALSIADIESRLGRPVDHEVPYDKGVLVSMNTGEPHVLSASSWFGFGRAMAGIVRDIESPASRPILPESAASAADAPLSSEPAEETAQ
jgi:pilus assembly protein CpaE